MDSSAYWLIVRLVQSNPADGGTTCGTPDPANIPASRSSSRSACHAR
ncbi:hypothetical protein AB0H83_45425 [Dactylosporangium sp. NPDC050688]